VAAVRDYRGILGTVQAQHVCCTKRC